MACIKFRPMIPTTLSFTLCSSQLTSNPQTISSLKNTISTSSSTIHYPELPNQWTGLHNWRHSSLNHHRFWGPNGPESSSIKESTLCGSISSATCLAEMGAAVLCTSDPLMKSKLTHLAYYRWIEEGLPVGCYEPPGRPDRPAKHQLVPPKEILSPKHSGLSFNAYMFHNLAHVELNAIDLAWDTVVSFSPYSDLLGDGFFADFAHVADDESRHFAWCSQRLSELGVSYDDMPSHNLLWRECEKSSNNVAARLSSIPLVQEARGLDTGPRLEANWLWRSQDFQHCS